MSALPPPAAAYVAQDDLFERLEALAAEQPERLAEEELGRTIRGRPIRAFHVAPTGTATSSLLVVAGIHAWEWIGTETADRFLRDLVVAPPEHVAVTVIPVLDADGRAATERAARQGRWEDFYRGNAANVDLNRDFPVNHEPRGPWSRILPGLVASSPAPLSQPESRALDALAARERYDTAVSLHSFGGYLYLPWAGAWERPDDWPELAELGRTMEAEQGRGAYKPRQLSRWGFFFRAHGTEIDHLYGTYGTRAFLIELTRTGLRPWHVLADRQVPFRWYDPEDPAPHVERGVRALHALVLAP